MTSRTSPDPPTASDLTWLSAAWAWVSNGWTESRPTLQLGRVNANTDAKLSRSRALVKSAGSNIFEKRDSFSAHDPNPELYP